MNKQVNWTGYSLDGGEPVTIGSNTTLEGLANGFHNVTVYAKDTFGNTGASETISFTVEVPDTFPTTIAIISGISAVIVVGAVWRYTSRNARTVLSESNLLLKHERNQPFQVT